MAEKPEDLNLPNSVVFRLIKESIPPGTNVSKDVRLAISKAASVFVLYCTATANAVAQAANRKTLSGWDVLTAMEEMEFEEFRPTLKHFLQEYKQSIASKKQKKSSSPNQKSPSANKSGSSSSPSKSKPGQSKKSPTKEKKPLTIRVEDSDASATEGSDDEDNAPLQYLASKNSPKTKRPKSGQRETRMDVDASDDDKSDDNAPLRNFVGKNSPQKRPIQSVAQEDSDTNGEEGSDDEDCVVLD